MRQTLTLIVLSTLAIIPNALSQSTTGFATEVVSSNWNQAVGLEFNKGGNVMFVWERAGKVWTVENNVRNLALDISEEVGAYGDLGMLGFALDPDFDINGYIYLLYTVDRHHLIYYGTSNYNSTSNWNYHATIQRVTRYTASKNSTGYIVSHATRKVLIGATRQTGIPSVAPVHGPGSLLFGTDGTLLIASGDAAGASGVDTGNATNTYWSLALSEKIITPAENVGAFRSQLLESYCGKILRIDPATGNGISSNPFYDPANPNSPRSKVWALGVRNGFRLTRKPGTGSSNPADANPGTIYLGDVGHVTWEELDVIDRPGMNLGWPLYEGFTSHTGYATRNVINMNAPNPAYGTDGCTMQYFYFRDLIKQPTASGTPAFTNPCNSQPITNVPRFVHSRPLIDWGHALTGPSRCGTFTTSGVASTMNIGATGAPVSGPQFNGKCAVGGIFYSHNDFPAEYRNTYIFADYTRKWIRSMSVDELNSPVSVGATIDTGAVVALALHPVNGGIYFIDFTSTIKKITHSSSNSQPLAVAKSDKRYGAAPLTVQFDGSSSTDPDGQPLSYLWNFGDGSTSTETKPLKTFTAPSAVSTKYLVRLTVTDVVGASASDSITIYVNNEPPAVTIIRPVAGDRYAMNAQMRLLLKGSATDREDSLENLNYEWTVVLHHDDHQHPEPPIYTRDASAITSPLGCGAETYFYRVYLKVTDNGGLSTTKSVDVHPYCDYITSFTLIDADNDVDIQTIMNGAVIDLSLLGIRNVTIRANTSPAVVYGVQLTLTGARSHSTSDRTAPYSLYGESKRNYNGQQLPAGDYHIQASAYNAKQVKGAELKTAFRLLREDKTASASVLQDETANQQQRLQLQTYPNPFRDYFILDVPTGHIPANLLVQDVYGRRLIQLNNVTPGKQLMIGKHLAAGMYFVSVRIGTARRTFKVVKQN